jgi:hypothetical protein
VKKRGLKLAAIVVDPANSGQGDATTDDASARVKVTEIMQKLQQGNGANFNDLVRENSEDASKFQNGELDYMSEDAMKQNFPPAVADYLMTKMTVGGITQAIPMANKYYIFKLLERNENDETLTLEKPGTKEQITNMLVNARKSLLQASYTAIAMNEAKIENLLAKQVVDNPNELSAARPAEAANSAAPSSSPAANSNSNAAANAKAPAANTAKPAAPAANNAKPAAPAAKPIAGAPANK